MWRRFGAATYAALIFAVFTIQAVALMWLTWQFSFGRSASGGPTSGLRSALTMTVGTTALLVMILTAYTLVYQSVSNARERRQRAEADTWRRQWVDLLYAGGTLPESRLSRAAVEGLVDVREKLVGSDAEAVDAVIRGRGVTHDLITVATSPRKYTLTRRLDALDLLARAGSPTGFDELARLTRDPEIAVRIMATRALARAAAALEDDGARAAVADMLVRAFADSEVPSGAIEEALLLLGPAASDVLGVLLGTEGPRQLTSVALDATGRLHRADLLGHVVPHLTSPRVDTRAAAWRAVGGIGTLVPEAAELLPVALSDAHAAVRSQAARAAHLLPAEHAISGLVPMLGDSSWWVRRAAASSLIRVGGAGVAALRDASVTNPDRFAQHIAHEVLSSASRLDATVPDSTDAI